MPSVPLVPRQTGIYLFLSRLPTPLVWLVLWLAGAALLALPVWGVSVALGAEPVVIHADHGGLLHEYRRWSMKVDESGARVEIRGVCASACTMILRVPVERICVSSGAALQFHLPTPHPPVPDSAFYKLAQESGTAMFWHAYPQPVREWIRQRGGLGTRLLTLAGADLRRMYGMCGA